MKEGKPEEGNFTWLKIGYIPPSGEGFDEKSYKNLIDGKKFGEQMS